jgi:hypothetical protein
MEEIEMHSEDKSKEKLLKNQRILRIFLIILVLFSMPNVFLLMLDVIVQFMCDDPGSTGAAFSFLFGFLKLVGLNIFFAKIVKTSNKKIKLLKVDILRRTTILRSFL